MAFCPRSPVRPHDSYVGDEGSLRQLSSGKNCPVGGEHVAQIPEMH
jgi:hypothetical protein